MANLTGSPLDSYVQDQIEIRQKVLGNNPEIQNLDVRVLNNHNKNSWVRLVSSVDVIGEDILSEVGTIPKGENLAKGFVLMGGVTNTIGGASLPRGGVIPDQKSNQYPLTAAQYSYGLGNLDYGLTPPPGLISAQIQHLNRGAIRKFQIKLQAQNKDQMAILEALYLRLGYYMLLEWGHTNYIDRNNKFVNNPDYTTPAYAGLFGGQSSNNIETAINNHRSITGGNYDGALFKVDNYSWSINIDGSYDITLSGISKGGLIDSLTMGTPGIFGDKATPIQNYTVILPSDNNERRTILNKLGVTTSDDEIVKIYKQTIAEKLAAGMYEFLKSSGAIKVISPNSVSNPKALNLKEAFDTSDDDLNITILDQNRSILNQVLFKLTRQLKKENWLRIGEKERYKSFQLRPELLTSLNLSELSELVSIKFDNVNKEDNPYEYNYITLGSLISIIKEKILTNENNPSGIKISDGYEDNLMFTHWFQHSTDPTVCLIPYSAQGGFEDNLNKIISKTFRVGTEGDQSYQGRLMAIHVNIEYISKTLRKTSGIDGKINLYSFLEELMYGIEVSLGRLNNFTVTYDDVNGLNIKDDTIIPGIGQEIDDGNQTKLRLYGTLPYNEGTFVRNISAQSKITSKMATQIAIGATASGTPVNESTALLSRWNGGLVDRIKAKDNEESLTRKLEIEFVAGTNSQAGPTIADEIREELDIKYAKQLKFLVNQYDLFQNQGNPTYSEAQTNLQSLLEYDLAIKTLNGNIAGKGMIPIDLTLEMEGISGILLSNKILTTNEVLPSSYNNKINFVVQAIDHTINGNEWLTTLSTLSCPKKSDKSKNISTKDNNEFSIPKTSSSSSPSSTPTSPSQASNSGKPEWMSDEAWIALQETENS